MTDDRIAKMTKEQIEQIRKKNSTQFKTIKRWCEELMEGETLIVLKGAYGQLTLECARGNAGDTMHMLNEYLMNLSKKSGISFSTLVGSMLIADDHSVRFVPITLEPDTDDDSDDSDQ